MLLKDGLASNLSNKYRLSAVFRHVNANTRLLNTSGNTQLKIETVSTINLGKSFGAVLLTSTPSHKHNQTV